MINIPLKVNGSLLYQDEIVKIASGSSNSIQVTFTIPQTSDFNDPTLTKKAIFRYYQGSYFISDVDANNQVIVPKFVIASPYFKIALRAENNDKTVVITTNEIQIPVDASPTLYDSTIVDGDVTIRNSDNTLHIYKVGDVTYIDFAQNYKTAVDGVINGNYATTTRVISVENSVTGIQSSILTINLEIVGIKNSIQTLSGDIDDLEETKADKSDVYTKGETEARLAEKQPVGDYATNTDLDNLETRVTDVEENKADKSDVYTKGETEARLAEKQPVGDYATNTDLDNLETRVTDVEETKADKADVYTKGETEARLAEKQPVGDYATNTDLDNLETRVTDVEETKANVDGNYPTMTTGNADNLIATKGLTLTDPFVFQKTGGEQASSIGDGNASITLRGNSVAWNHLSRTSASGGAGVTITTSNNNRYSFDGEAQVAYYGMFNFVSVTNHKYLTAIVNLVNPNSLAFRWGDLNGAVFASSLYEKNITTSYNSGNHTFGFEQFGGVGTELTGLSFTGIIIDLTQMFGVGNEPTSVDDPLVQWAIMYAQLHPEYDAGSLISCKSSKLISRGINQWDEEWVVGSITSDGSIAVTGTIYGTSYNRCTPNETYYSNVPLRLAYYDANKTFLYRDTNAGNVHAIPSNAQFFRPTMTTNYGTTYNNDICINISNTNINGTYYPSEEHTVDLPDDELRSAGFAYDERSSNGTRTQRIGVVDLGTLDYIAQYAYGINEFYTRDLANLKSISYSQVANVLCSKFQAVNRSYNGEGVATESDILFIKTNQYGLDVQAFKSAMSGVLLFYELAEPIVTNEDPFTGVIPVKNGGTMEFVGNNVPQGNEIFYQKNIKAFVESFGEAIDWNPERIERLANLSFTPEIADITLNPAQPNAYAKVQVMSSTFTIVISTALTGTPNGEITFQDSEIDLSSFETKPAESIYDIDGKKVSEAPTTTDCNIASFVGRSYNGVVLWEILHSGVNKIKVHFEQAIQLDSDGKGKVDCRESLIL